MRMIEDPGDVKAVCYIGDTTVANREVLVFNIRIKPEGEDSISPVKFQRQFYSD
jgi:hypothetical protein